MKNNTLLIIVVALALLYLFKDKLAPGSPQGSPAAEAGGGGGGGGVDNTPYTPQRKVTPLTLAQQNSQVRKAQQLAAPVAAPVIGRPGGRKIGVR